MRQNVSIVDFLAQIVVDESTKIADVSKRISTSEGEYNLPMSHKENICDNI
jgi:hypothetical protein